MKLALPRPWPVYDTRDQAEMRRSIETEAAALRELLLQAQQDITTLKARLAAAGIP